MAIMAVELGASRLLAPSRARTIQARAENVEKCLSFLIESFGRDEKGGMIVAFGLLYLWDRTWIRIAGTIVLFLVFHR